MLDEGLFNINNITLGPLKTKLSSEIIDFYVDETIFTSHPPLKETILGAISIFWEIIARGPKNQKNI
jgi:hypothetical protein